MTLLQSMLITTLWSSSSEVASLMMLFFVADSGNRTIPPPLSPSSPSSSSPSSPPPSPVLHWFQALSVEKSSIQRMTSLPFLKTAQFQGKRQKSRSNVLEFCPFTAHSLKVNLKFQSRITQFLNSENKNPLRVLEIVQSTSLPFP